MNKIKSRLAMLLAVILLTGSLQGPVFAVQSGQGGAAAGVSAQKGTVDPDQVTQTEPLDLVPEEDTPEDPPEEEFYTVTVQMDGGYGGVYNGDVFDDALGQYVTDASSFVKKVKKGEAVEFMPGSLYIGGDHQHDFLGWSLEPGGEIVGTKTSYTPVGDCTLYANWRRPFPGWEQGENCLCRPRRLGHGTGGSGLRDTRLEILQMDLV